MDKYNSAFKKKGCRRLWWLSGQFESLQAATETLTEWANAEGYGNTHKWRLYAGPFLITNKTSEQ